VGVVAFLVKHSEHVQLPALLLDVLRAFLVPAKTADHTGFLNYHEVFLPILFSNMQVARNGERHL